jgi:hypothetical protein
MGVNLSKISHVLFFVILLPFLSFLISYLFHKIFPNLPFWMETLTPLCAYGTLVALFDKYIWGWRIFCVLGLVIVPDLRGRWEGYQRTSFKEKGNNLEIPSCLEISQTYSHIYVRACYERSQSESAMAGFISSNGKHYLCYTYDNEPNSLKSGTMQSHKGTVKFEYFGKDKRLEGSYFNSLGNQGEIFYKFIQKDLIGRFNK